MNRPRVGHDSGQRLDYMHARYFGPMVGRFLAVDPIDGETRYPQSWNRYTYARSNPVKLVDPTGLYVFVCADGDATCAANAKAFEDARQTNLQSKDAVIAAAAAAYGDPGVANGVKVKFGAPGEGQAGVTGVAPRPLGEGAGMGLDATVVILNGTSNTQLQAAVAHEGRHLQDAWGFVNSFDAGLTTWDVGKNLTFEQTETNAYRITHSIYRAAGQTFGGGCSGCDLGLGARTPADINLAIKRILSNPHGTYFKKLNDRQFGDFPPPSISAPSAR